MWVLVALLCMAGCVRAGDCAGRDAPRGCTVFTIARGERVFFGGNDDWHNFDSSVYWVDPGGAGYGAVYFGAPDNVQQGFNVKGLAYDANGLPRAPIRDTSMGWKPSLSAGESSLSR